MNLILFRHGTSTDNVKGLISDKEIYWSVLTENGKKDVKESISLLPKEITAVYVSPLPRTIQTANFIYEKYSSVDFIIDDRIKEIQYGKYSHCKNNEELDNIRQRQINGDYFCRFGDFGENKYDIEMRLSSFLVDLLNKYKNDENIIVVTHGSISSYIKRILKLTTSHLQTGKIEVYNDVNLLLAKENLEMLDKMKVDS